MAEGRRYLPLAINRLMDTIKDSMDSLKEVWSTHKTMGKWATMQTIPTHHTDNKAKFISNVSTESSHAQQSRYQAVGSCTIDFPDLMTMT